MVKRTFYASGRRVAAALAGLSIAVVLSCGLFLAIGPGSSRPVLAQQPVPIQRLPGGGLVQFGRPAFRSSLADGDEPPDIFLPVDREVTLQWEQAKSLLEQGHYSEAITLLDGILERPDDFFLKPDDATHINDRKGRRSLKLEAQRLISDLPPEGQAAYELQFGATAARMLATSSGEIAKLEEISRKYFYTKAGYQATLLLGRHQLDHNHPLEAAACFQRLLDCPAAAAAMNPSLSVLLASSWLRAGMKDRAAGVMAKLQENDPKATLRVADKTVHLFSSDAGVLAWLQSDVVVSNTSQMAKSADWQLVRGDTARNAESDGGAPLLTSRWEVPTANHPALEKALETIRKQNVEQQGIAKLPAMQPLAVGNLVLMRTTTGLLAVDFATGKRIWPVRSGDDSSLEQLLSSSPSDGLKFDVLNNYALRERFWEDNTFGSIASDGQQVFLLEGLDLPVNGQEFNGGIQFNQVRGRVIRGPFVIDPQAQARQVNMLSAYELRSQGKLKWQVGGQTSDYEPQLAGAFFLGPPLPMDGKLYVLAEMKTGEIKLCVVDGQTGRLDWSQQIANTESGLNILQDPQRRLAGCSPSYADGILVCPTSSRAVVAVDIHNRTLLWGFQYDRDPIYGQGFGRTGIVYNSNPMESIVRQERWTDVDAVIADNYVLVTPVESNRLFCLNLADGSKQWEQPRGENMYIAGVHHGKVLLVGKHQMTALSLANGKLAWGTGPVAYADAVKSNSVNGADASLPPVPSGRGYLSGDEYFLPLSSAEVMCINVNDGKIIARGKSREGIVPGNLICHEGEVISQGVDSLDTFFQIKPLRERIAQRLAKDPDDSWALAHRGELALSEGHVDDALADLRRAYQLDDNSYDRDLYMEAMRAAISKDFNKHRADLRDWEHLAKLDSELAIVLRVKAVGLLKADEPLEALESLIRLSALEPAADDLDQEDLDPNWSVARSRWVRMQFDDLWSAAKSSDRQQISAALQGYLDHALKADEPLQALRQFVRCFGNHPLGDRARELLVERLSGGDSLLEREQLLRRLEQSANPQRKAAATAKFAGLLRDADQPQAALIEYKRLESLVGQQPALEGKSVQQMLASLPLDSPLRLASALPTAWLPGAVQVDKLAPDNRMTLGTAHATAVGVELRGDPGPFFKDVALNYDMQRQEIFGRVGTGKKDRFSIALADLDRSNNMLNQFNDRYAFAQGHLLALSTGYQLFGLDTLKPSGMPGNRIIWQRDLGDNNLINNGLVLQQFPWGGVRRLPLGGENSNQLIGAVGPCTDSALCFVRGRDVSAIDPLTGSLLWVRHGIEPGSEIFGDDEVTIVAPPENIGANKPALVLRTADGKLLGQRTIPVAKRLTAYGRNLLVSRSGTVGTDTVVVAMYDPVAERDVWTESFHGVNGGTGGVKGTMVDSETVALMEPKGGFVMLRLADGHKLVDEKLEEELGLQSIHVLRSPKQDILITNRLLFGGGGIVGPRGIQRFQLANVIVSSPGSDFSVIPVTGHVYAFDRSTGKPQWSGPATIDQHGLLLTQPTDLPVLTFIRTLTPQRPGQNQIPHGSVLCLDKRNGSCIYSDDNWPENLQNASMLQVVGDPEKQTVTLQWGREELALTFTGKPATAAEPYHSGSAEKTGTPTDSDKIPPAPTTPHAKSTESNLNPSTSPTPAVAPAATKPGDDKSETKNKDKSKDDLSH